MKHIALKLFVIGASPLGTQAQKNINALKSRFSDYEFKLEVVDILENPGEAANYKIIATPTLIKHQPAPTTRVVGDLSDTERVLMALNLYE